MFSKTNNKVSKKLSREKGCSERKNKQKNLKAIKLPSNETPLTNKLSHHIIISLEWF
jgi:hypothetical protein